MERNIENKSMNSFSTQEEAAFNAMFSNIPVQTLLSLDENKSLIPLYADNFTFSPSQIPFHFFPANPCSSSSILNCMPPLESLESSSADHKRPKLDPVITNSLYQRCIEGSSSTAPVSTQTNKAKKKSTSSRPTLSDKTRALQKLMPWNNKMHISTMLEEACKYVKYLQTQLKALQSMPDSSTVCCELSEGVFGGLGRLNRQQLLEVFLNSAASQTRLYSQGCCVLSLEQLVFLKRMAERKQQQQQQQYQMMLYDPSKLS